MTKAVAVDERTPPNELAGFGPGTREHSVTLSTGIQMRYFSAGPEGAPRVLFVHGFPELAVSWRAQFAELAKDHHVIAPDMRGYGGTDAPTGWRNYSIEKLSADVFALLAHLGDDPVHLVGHDWGGAITWECAMQDASRFRSLSALNCPPLRTLVQTIWRNPRQTLRSWYMLYFQIPRVPEFLFCLDPERSAINIFRDTAANKAPFNDAGLVPFVTQFRNLGIPAMDYYRCAFRRATPELRPIAIPTQLIWGMKDEALGPWFATDPVYETFASDFHRVLIDDAAHWVQEEAPSEVNAALRAHFARADLS